MCASEMLDEFQSTKLDSSKSATVPAAAAAEAPSAAPQPADDEPSMDEFARHIQASMADMMKELEQDPESMKQFEQLMKGFADPKEFDVGPEPAATSPSSSAKATTGAATAAPTAGPSAPTAKSTAAGAAPGASDAAFQDTIRRTMERMKASSASADESVKNPAEDDMMAQLLKELAAAGGEGADGDDAFSKMLLGMMEQLTNKDILYEPMKELDGKFDDWLAENTTTGKIKKEDEDRYREQRRLVGEIVKRFDKEGYSDANAGDREYIVDRMQKVCYKSHPRQSISGYKDKS